MYTCITFYSNTNSLIAILKLASITVYFREKKNLVKFSINTLIFNLSLKFCEQYYGNGKYMSML